MTFILHFKYLIKLTTILTLLEIKFINTKNKQSIKQSVNGIQNQMKVSLSRPQSKKTKPVVNSKKNSHTNSLIYKEINSQMQQIFSKSKYLNNNQNLYNRQKDEKQKQQKDKEKVSKKNSYIHMKKNKEKQTPNISTQDTNNKIITINKLNNNFMAGMNSPVTNSDNSDNEEQNNSVQLMHLKKSIGLKSVQPNISPSMIKSTHTSIANIKAAKTEKNSENITPAQSSLNTPSGTLSKKSYTKTKIKLEAKLFSHYKLERKLFCYDYIIGKGGFGKVWKVEHMKTRNQYAMKQMLKSIVITKKSVQSVMNERVLLSQLNSPFLVNMHYSFQDRDTLYLVLDLMQGGDLRYHIGNKSFSEIQSKFFVACIILGLEHMHRNNIIHRDIKPENLVLDSRGYIRITDLGIARILRANNSSDTSGTPGYMSPQVICRQNHGFCSDFFALGVIAYELMTGKRPYNGRTRNQIRDNMLAKQAQVRANQLPDDWSFQAADFINRLIQRKPQNRLGFSSIDQIKSHPWVRTINWEKLYTKEIQSPFIPMMKKKNFDQDEQITIEDQEQAQLIQKNSLLLRKPEFQQLFKEYYYDENENLLTAKQAKKTASSSHHRNSNPNTVAYTNATANNNSHKQSKKNIISDKDKQSSKPHVNKIGGKKYSQQIYLGKRSSNANTIEQPEKQVTIRNKNNSIGSGNDIIMSLGKALNLNTNSNSDNMETVLFKDGQIHSIRSDKRKTSIGNSKGSGGPSFFKDFRH